MLLFTHPTLQHAKRGRRRRRQDTGASRSNTTFSSFLQPLTQTSPPKEGGVNLTTASSAALKHMPWDTVISHRHFNGWGSYSYFNWENHYKADFCLCHVAIFLCVIKVNLHSSVQQNVPDVKMHRKYHLYTYTGFQRDHWRDYKAA